MRLRSDEQLVKLFRAGNEDAFRTIHDRYRARLFAYTRQMLSGSRQDAEDALQDVFVRAYAALRANDREVSLRAWLYRVAHNRCIDELRRPAPPAPEVFEQFRPPTSDPIEETEQRESLRRLVADVRRLPEQQRSALLMREIVGMSYSDLGAALDVTVPAVKSLLVRARMGLAQAAEARDTACVEIREELTAAHDRGVRSSGLVRRHLHDCASCRAYKRELKTVQQRFAALVPALGPLAIAAKLLGIGGGGGAAASAGAGGGAGAATAASAAGGGAAAAGGAGAAAAGAGAAGGVAAGGSAGAAAVGAGAAVGGSVTAGHVAAVVAVAVVAGGGAVEAHRTLAPHHHHHVKHAAAVVRTVRPQARMSFAAAVASARPSSAAAVLSDPAFPSHSGAQHAPAPSSHAGGPGAHGGRSAASTGRQVQVKVVVSQPASSHAVSAPTTSSVVPVNVNGGASAPDELGPDTGETDPTTTTPTDPTTGGDSSASTDPTNTTGSDDGSAATGSTGGTTTTPSTGSGSAGDITGSTADATSPATTPPSNGSTGATTTTAPPVAATPSGGFNGGAAPVPGNRSGR